MNVALHEELHLTGDAIEKIFALVKLEYAAIPQRRLRSALLSSYMESSQTLYRKHLHDILEDWMQNLDYWLNNTVTATANAVEASFPAEIAIQEMTRYQDSHAALSPETLQKIRSVRNLIENPTLL
jgi:hypothetical protein